MTTKLITILSVMLALFVRAFRVVASACSAVRSASIACVRGVVRVFVPLALCMSAPVYADDDVNRYYFVEDTILDGRFSRYTNELGELLMAGKGTRTVAELLEANADPRLGVYNPGSFGELTSGLPVFITPLMHKDLTEENDEEKRLIEAHCEERGWDCRKPDLDSVAEAYFESKYCRGEGIDCQQTMADIVRRNAMMANGFTADAYLARLRCYSGGGRWLAVRGECREKQDAVPSEDEPVAPSEEESTPSEEPVAAPESDRAEPKASYGGVIYSAAFIVADSYLPSWVDTQTFAFNAGDSFVTGQSLSIPLDDFTFAATRVQVNNAADYEFGVKWEMEF